MNLHNNQFCFPLIFNSLKISTITIGARTNPIVSNIFSTGKTGMLNIVLNAGTASIIIINKAEIPIAPNNVLFPPIPVLNIDFSLFLILNT